MNPFARNPANQVGELRRTVITSVFQLAIEGGVSSLIADLAQLAFENSNLRIARVGSSENVTPITDWNCFRREIGNEIWTISGRNIPFRSLIDRIPKNLLTLGTGRRRRRRKVAVEVAS